MRDRRRIQYPDEERGLVMRGELDSGDVAPEIGDVEFERRQGHRAHFPVSTTRGGSVSSRGHSYTYGASLSLAPIRSWDTEEEEIRYGAPSWSDGEHERETGLSAPTRHRRERPLGSVPHREHTGSEPVSSATSPIPSERSTSAQSYGDEHAYSSAYTSTWPRREHEYSQSWSAHRPGTTPPLQFLYTLSANLFYCLVSITRRRGGSASCDRDWIACFGIVVRRERHLP